MDQRIIKIILSKARQGSLRNGVAIALLLFFLPIGSQAAAAEATTLPKPQSPLPLPGSLTSNNAPSTSPSTSFPPSPPGAIDIDPKLIQESPVLRRWLQEIPNVMQDIQQDPSFRTRFRLGYSQFPSTNQAGGWNVGLEDLFLGKTGLTLSADYQGTFKGDRSTWGADLRYYTLPLGGYINLAPVLGYRHLETTRYNTEGVNLGLRLLLVPSRTGATDISLTQSWVSPGGDAEVGLTTLSFGYALTHNLRLSTDIQKQNSRQNKDSRVGIVLEWMF